MLHGLRKIEWAYSSAPNFEAYVCCRRGCNVHHMSFSVLSVRKNHSNVALTLAYNFRKDPL